MSKESISPKFEIVSIGDMIDRLGASLTDTLKSSIKKPEDLIFFKQYLAHIRLAYSEYSKIRSGKIKKPSEECIQHVQSANRMYTTLVNKFPGLKNNTDFQYLYDKLNQICINNAHLGPSQATTLDRT